jgi:hypothetical protein
VTGRAWAAFFVVTLLMRRWEAPAQAMTHVLVVSAAFSTVYLLIAVAIRRYSVWRLALFWLGVPYCIFAFGWLRWYWAMPCAVVWILALWRSARGTDSDAPMDGPAWFAGLTLVLAWVYISGAGGHGLQSPDYALHNGRLMDLIDEPWPVNYSTGRWVTTTADNEPRGYLVGYHAYYLPAALFGKLAGYGCALEFLHVWTLLGCWLAVSCLAVLVGTNALSACAIALIAFGGWDFVGTLVRLHATPGPPLMAAGTQLLALWDAPPEFVDFWTTEPFEFFFGNYLSNSAQMFWAPHQSVAGWVWISLLTRSFFVGRLRQVCFVYALAAFWSPMNLIAGAPFPLALLVRAGVRGLLPFLSFENVVAGGSMLAVFGLYYAGGTAYTNPASWLWTNIDPSQDWWLLLVFHTFSWGIYASVVIASWRRLGSDERFWFATLATSLVLLSSWQYGTYNDLLVRGSASLMFLLLVYFLRCMRSAWRAGTRAAATGMLMLAVPGSLSAALHLRRSVAHSHEQWAPQSIANYSGGWQFLGGTDSFFARHLSREVRHTAPNR